MKFGAVPELIDDTYPELLQYLQEHRINIPDSTPSGWSSMPICNAQEYETEIINGCDLYTYDNSKLHLNNKKIFICAGCELTYLYDYLNFTCDCYHTFVSKTSMDIFSEING